MTVIPLHLPGKSPKSDQPDHSAELPAGLTVATVDLLRNRQVPAHAVLSALRRGARGDLAISQSLTERTRADTPSDARMLRDLAGRQGLGALTPAHGPPDPALIDTFGATACLTEGLMPWRRVAGLTIIATPSAEAFARLRPRLTALFGPVLPAFCPDDELRAAVLRQRGAALIRAAETAVPAALSCRSYDPARMARRLGLGGLALMPVLLWHPVWLLAVFTLLAITAMAGFMGLRLAAWLALRKPEPDLPQITIARLPVVSVILALYGENDIASRLIKRLKALDYPPDLLDVILAVEDDDHATRAALARTELPLWIRVIRVPAGTVRTKPRALNYALDHCRGSFVGIYDAEDAPAPDQIRRMVAHFHARGSDVVCLQGILDYYNPNQNWLSRCFTIEYAAWFRLLLPGIARLGLVVPLGGTTLFFRRAALEELGRWDAHNVTEDCDLGIRIARRGWRTEVVQTTTYEEANCHARAWVKQRSRWIKGFMMTWLTHMRNPLRLWQELGPKRFLGVQLLVFGSVCHALLAPLLWSFWVSFFGIPHPLALAMGPQVFRLLGAAFVISELLGMAFGMAGLLLARQKINPLWLLTMAPYNALATLAAWKAAYEMILRPFWWDKTRHGLSDDSP
ncbi:glycosyltransferase [Fuscibacter oryzae]|uniref:Glycosyltransferase n=1 Tax=Fuscibacter oryzae TaxID=2803939 RepID=A0A8J7MS78_9RHOB|nr:glycosyltransferase [Fuscibacter oryzae]MBL4928672.1 glycosyltransferase [Fuscibacter oryzae]